MVEDTEEHIEWVLSAYGTPLTEVSLFHYLVQTLSSTNDNWLAVEQNLRRARGKWGQLEISWEGRERLREQRGGFMRRWCKRCSCLGMRRGS